MLNDTFLTSRLDAALGWARKFSIFQYPFVTACCGMEYMATACSHYDVDRFGAGLPRFSPRQADVLFVVGTISHKMAPVLKRIHVVVRTGRSHVLHPAAGGHEGILEDRELPSPAEGRIEATGQERIV